MKSEFVPGARTWTAALLLLAALASAPAAWSQASPRGSLPSREPGPAELLAELRKGGYVIYLRHAATDMSKNDANMKNYEDCANQRNLVDRGRDDARSIAAAFRDLRIPVGRVLASPFCRTVETAQLVFGRAEKMQEVRGGPAVSAEPERYAALRKLMSAAPEAGTNLAIASHGNPFYNVAGPPYLAEGEAAVIRPLGDNFEIFARIRVENWNALRDAARP